MHLKAVSINEPSYLSFVKRFGNVYNSPQWLSLYGSNVTVKGVYEDDKLLAVFNTYKFKKAFFSFFIPPPFSPDCALVFDPVKKSDEVKKIISDFLIKESAKKKYSLFRFAFSYAYTDVFEGVADGAKLNHTYVLDLSQAEDIQSLYAPKRRQQIRRAIKDGLKTELLNDYEVLFELIVKTFRRQKKSIDEKFIRKILFEFANPKNSFAFVAVKENRPITGYFCIHYNDYAFYLLGGYDEKEKHIGAGPLAMNACIEHAKKLNIKTFDFEGSMEPAIERYFKEFGGQKRNYLCFEKTNGLGNTIIKAKKLIKG